MLVLESGQRCVGAGEFLLGGLDAESVSPIAMGAVLSCNLGIIQKHGEDIHCRQVTAHLQGDPRQPVSRIVGHGKSGVESISQTIGGDPRFPFPQGFAGALENAGGREQLHQLSLLLPTGRSALREWSTCDETSPGHRIGTGNRDGSDRGHVSL